jgi:biopolymer transport protein ExbD
MAFGTQDDTDEVMNEINMTPLVDVMLVLLIVFIVTVPVLRHAVHVQLPHASAQALAAPSKPLQLSVQADGQYRLGDTILASDAELETTLAQSANQSPDAELHIQGDRAARYERIAQAMAAAQRAGLTKISFVMTPQGQSAQGLQNAE